MRRRFREDDDPGERYVRKRREIECHRMNGDGRQKMDADDVHWFVGISGSGKEFAAQKKLVEWGAFTYLPLARRWRMVNRYKKEKVRFGYPAFAGYLFVGLPDDEERWLDLFELEAISAVLSVGDRPAEVNGEVLRKFIDGNSRYFVVPNEQRYMRTGKEFEVGDRVRIASGPFVDHLVDVQSISHGMAHIVLPLLGTTQDVEIPLDQLEAVE